MHKKRAILWFRQDLRLHDNEALTDALSSVDEVIPIYIFDERICKCKTHFGFPKTGKFRLKFIIESVRDLRDSFRKLGAELVVRIGIPEEVIFEIARSVKSNWFFCNREWTQEEVAVQDALEKRLWSIGQEVRFSRGKMLYYTADLPFPITHIPDTFSHFRKEVERFVSIRQPLPGPVAPFNPPDVNIEPGLIPRLEDFGFEAFEPDPRAALDFKGGETEGLKRLQYFLWESGLFHGLADNNGLPEGDYSSKFSPWLSQGCLSPKTIFREMKKCEKVKGESESFHLLFLNLLWRDFFRFIGKKNGNKIFQKGGIKGQADAAWVNDRGKLQLWIDGKTGVPFIDANMQEIRHTGYMSKRGRQNVAGFLVNDLKINWQMGAEYFESMLIDYDPCSNWGNWSFIAGLGSDAKDSRHLNVLSQTKRYDPHGEYAKVWL